MSEPLSSSSSSEMLSSPAPTKTCEFPLSDQAGACAPDDKRQLAPVKEYSPLQILFAVARKIEINSNQLTKEHRSKAGLIAWGIPLVLTDDHPDKVLELSAAVFNHQAVRLAEQPGRFSSLEESIDSLRVTLDLPESLEKTWEHCVSLYRQIGRVEDSWRCTKVQQVPLKLQRHRAQRRGKGVIELLYWLTLHDGRTIDLKIALSVVSKTSVSIDFLSVHAE